MQVRAAKRLAGRFLVTAATVIVAGWGAWGWIRTAHAQPAKPPAGAAAVRAGGTAAPARDPRIADLDAQIKSLRDQYHEQLQALDDQMQALHAKFDPQIKALEDQRRDLVESGKPPGMKTIDDQEQAELKSLADQEMSEIQKVRQHYADLRKDLRARYQQRRKELHGGQ
jgi:hypothetical protein